MGANRTSAGVIRDSAGNIYGAAAAACYSSWIRPARRVLHSFTGGVDGRPTSRDPRSAGNFYGTSRGRPHRAVADLGCGVVYKLDADGQETVLHTFTGGADGGTPNAGVIRDSDGNLYGTTVSGGACSLLRSGLQGNSG